MPPVDTNTSDDGLVTVLTADGQGAMDRAKAILHAGGIEYSTRNERFPDIPFCGRMISVSRFTGPPEIQVRRQDEAQARALLDAEKA